MQHFSRPFHYARHGSLLVGVDLHEIVAYDGSSESPIWLTRAAHQVMFVHVTARQVVTLDCVCKVARFSAVDGVELDSIPIMDGGPENAPIPLDFDVAYDGFAVAAADDQVVFASPKGDITRTRVPGVRKVAFSIDGQQVGVALDDGRVQVLDRRGQFVSGGRADTPITAICAQPYGWVLAAGDQVFEWDGDEFLDPIYRIKRADIDQICCNDDATVLAVRSGPSRVVVVEFDEGRRLGELNYPDRPVTNVAFGPGYWLGIGLDKSDGNRVDLRRGALHRTDTHPDRPHNSWLVNVNIDIDAVLEITGESSYMAGNDMAGDDWADSSDEYGDYDDEDHGDENLSEMRRIDVLHDRISRLGPDGVGLALRTGFIPTEPAVLIEAGMRMLPLIAGSNLSDPPSQAAAARLEALISRIDILAEPDLELTRAREEMAKALRAAQKRDRNDTIMGCGCVVLILIAVIAGIAAWVSV